MRAVRWSSAAVWLAVPCLVALAACRSAGRRALDQARKHVPDLSIAFEGNRTFTRQELLDAIADDLGELSADGLDRPDVDDLAYTIEVHYRTLGFPDAYVGYELQAGASSGGEGGTRVRFRIEEGRRARVEDLRIQGSRENGDPSLTEAALRPFFGAPGPELLSPVNPIREQPWWFVRARLDAGVSALRDFYLAKGYLSAKVEGPDVEWLDSGRTRARVTVHVDQGPRWVLSEAVLDLEHPLAANQERELRRVLEEGRKDADGRLLPYTLRLAYAIRAKLLERLGEWGHPDGHVEIAPETLEEGKTRVTFHVVPGPRVHIGAVKIDGNEKTRTSFLRSRLTVAQGDVYDSRAVRRSFQRLFDTGLFRTVSIDLAPVEKEDPDATDVRRDLLVHVLEAPSLEVTVEPGYGSYEGPRLRLGVEDSNILGTGRSAKVETTAGAKAQEISLGLSDRALFDSEYAGDSAVYFHHRKEPSFTFQERGLALSVSRRWQPSIEASLGYNFRQTNVLDVQVEDALVADARADVDIASITLSVSRDSRDRFFEPAHGTYSRAVFEWASSAFGSQVDFLSGHLEGSWFHPLPWSGAVFATGVQTGLITPLGATTVLPLQVRLFNGGENTVRSFREDELGPRDANGKPIGGEAYTVISAELRQRLAGPLSTALFYDAGNLEPDHEQYLHFDGMRQAVGVGLRWSLPIGPIRLDLGVNPDPKPGEPDYVLHLSVGMAF